jgi:hypothetical protein
LKDKPTTEDFMLLADGNDLNPTMIIRWQLFLERSRGRHDPVLAIWHALAALPAEQFAAQAPATVERLIAGQSPDKLINPLVAGAFLGKPIKELAEAARIYGELLGAADKLWRQAVEQADAAKHSPPP